MNTDPESRAGPQEQDPVPSPCTGICRMNAQTGWCDGCQRTLDEIIDWGVAPESKKRAIWQAIRKRRAAE